MNLTPKFIVVIGTSAGGVRALEELIVQLTPEMDAAFYCAAPGKKRRGRGIVSPLSAAFTPTL